MAKQKAKQENQAPKKPASKKITGTWARNYYIRDFGHVKVGEAVTAAAMKAWNKRTNAKPQIEG